MYTGGSMRPAPADEAQRKQLQYGQYHQDQQTQLQQLRQEQPEQAQLQDHLQHHPQHQHQFYYMNRQYPPVQPPPPLQFNDPAALWTPPLPDIGLHHLSFERSPPPLQYDYQYQNSQIPAASHTAPVMERDNSRSTCGTSYCARVDCEDNCVEDCVEDCEDENCEDGCDDACNEPDCEGDECAVLCTGGCGAPPEIDCEDCQKCRATVCKDKNCVQADCSGCEPCPSTVCSVAAPAVTPMMDFTGNQLRSGLGHDVESAQPSPMMHYRETPSMSSLTAPFDAGNRQVPPPGYCSGMENFMGSQSGLGQHNQSYGNMFSYPSMQSVETALAHNDPRPSKRRRSDTYTMQSLVPPSPIATLTNSSSSRSPSIAGQHRGSISSQSLMHAPHSAISTSASTPTLYNLAVNSSAMSLQSIPDESLNYFCHWGTSCEQKFNDYPALDSHVLNAHLRPLQVPQHTDYSCRWESCENEEKDLGQLLLHVKSLHAACPIEASAHAHSPHDHVCLWQGCNASFRSSDDLSTHLATQHIAAPLCMWDECGTVVDGFETLATHLHTTHVVPHDKHLNMPHVPMTTPAVQISSPSLPAPPMLPMRMQSVDTESAPSATATSTTTATPTTVPSPCVTDAGNSQCSPSSQQEHDCRWWDSEAGPMCGQHFESADALQTHVRDVHIAALKKKTGYFCLWADCCRRDKQFSQKGKVERHMQTHTGCKKPHRVSMTPT